MISRKCGCCDYKISHYLELIVLVRIITALIIALLLLRLVHHVLV